MRLFFLYGAIAFLNLILLITMQGTMSQRSPRLFNTSTKRIAWLLSCLVSVPMLIFLFQLPGFFYGEIKRFISGARE